MNQPRPIKTNAGLGRALFGGLLRKVPRLDPESELGATVNHVVDSTLEAVESADREEQASEGVESVVVTEGSEVA